MSLLNELTSIDSKLQLHSFNNFKLTKHSKEVESHLMDLFPSRKRLSNLINPKNVCFSILVISLKDKSSFVKLDNPWNALGSIWLILL